MNREEIIADFFENMASLHRRMALPREHSLPKNMPSRAQLGVLFMIEHHGKHSVKELAERFCMSSSATTQLIDGLVKDKLLARKEDTSDRRKSSIALTAMGKKKVALAKKMRAVWFGKLFKSLTTEELLQLRNIQEKIIDGLK